jgi:hypothetical protein
MKKPDLKKLDLKKELKHLYAPSAKEVQVVDVPELSFVMLDLEVEPDETPETSQAFQQAMMALYGASYTLKFMSKLRPENPIDYTVMALEGLWWTESGEFDFSKKEAWQATLMMMQPEHISVEMYEAALRQIAEKQAKKGEENPALDRLRFERFQEGLCLQIMHIGPYSEEPRTIERMKVFAQESGYVYRGKHHEIYLGDPRLAKPENLRTILRQPVEKAG